MSKKLLANVGNTVVDNYRRYYQEYEGTFITATNKSEDDTLDTSRYIEVTEIWGNTVQDENNLEDIQSVGELYVDEEGQPILDDLGREQYKIEIEVRNKNRWLNDFKINNLNPIFIKAGTNVSISYESTNMEDNNSVSYHRKDGSQIDYWNTTTDKSVNRKYTSFKTLEDAHYLKLYNFIFNAIPSKITLLLDEKNPQYVEHICNKTTILLPCQLQKVGDVADRLYWDNEKGKYVVEKNILKTKLLNFKSKYKEFFEKPTIADKFDSENIDGSFIRVYGNIAEGFEWNGYYVGAKISGNLALSFYSDVRGRAYPYSGEDWTLEEVNAYIGDGKELYAKLLNPQLIETNITEKIQLPCYKEKTHIFVNSTVDATMKVLVPYKEII